MTSDLGSAVGECLWVEGEAGPWVPSHMALKELTQLEVLSVNPLDLTHGLVPL